MSDLVIVFAGSPAAAVPSLRLIAASRHEVAAVITREDSPQGRRRDLKPTAVATAAADLGLPVIRANRLAGAATDRVEEIAPDLGVIVAYGGLVREPLLSTPRLGWINLHFSLLPRWRGAAPVQRAIMAGDDVTGAAVFQLVPELDAGDLFGQSSRSIGVTETAGELLDSLAVSGAELLLRVIDAIADGTARAEPQAGEVTLAPKLELADGRLDWSEAATRVLDRLRGVTPEPGAFTTIAGDRLKVLGAGIVGASIAGAGTGVATAALRPGQLDFVDGRVLIGTATEALNLITVQPAGKKAMNAADWWRGRPADATRVAE